jgi:hypothetical protein
MMSNDRLTSQGLDHLMKTQLELLFLLLHLGQMLVVKAL